MKIKSVLQSKHSLNVNRKLICLFFIFIILLSGCFSENNKTVESVSIVDKNVTVSAISTTSGTFTFAETFNGYIEGTKASANIVDKTKAPVLWSEEAYTEIVSFEKLKTYKGLEAATLIQNPKIKSDSIPRTSNSESMLLFKYASGINSWSEQRWNINQTLLGKKGLEDIWMQYDVYIAGNYMLTDNVPESGNYFGGGHKVNVFYADGYSSPYTTIIFGELISRKSPSGSVEYDHNGYVDATLSTYPNGADSRVYTYYGDLDARVAKWMDIKTDLGTWQRRTFHFKFPTSADSNDGVVEVWLKRSNGIISKLIDGKSSYGYNRNYFNGGYINGYNNGGFQEETFMLIDNVIIADNKSAVDLNAIN